MKKYLFPALCIVLITVAFIAIFFIYKNDKAQERALISTQPFQVAALKESIIGQNIRIDDACKNPQALNQSVLQTSTISFDERLKYLCEDQILSKELESHFGNNTDYTFFLNCAKTYASEMQQIMKDLKEHYPEDYKNLNFNQSDILLKYLKHPATSILKAQCEAKSEALYWKSLSQSNKVEDLKFCIQITSECINGTTKPEECPANFKTHHDDCTKKLSNMKSAH